MEERFGRWNILFLQYLKRDWKRITVWVLGLGLFSSALIPAFEEIIKGEGLLGMYEALQNPAMIFMVGPTPVRTANEYTLGAMYSHEMLLFCGLFAMIISLLYVVEHSRKEEDLGLIELIRSFQIGRHANSFAIMVEVTFINILLAFLIAGVMIIFGADTISAEGSILFGVSIGLAGIMGAATALCLGQIMPISSATTGSSLGLIGLLYIVRGGTDISNLGLSMLNPLGWVYLTYPFTENNWIPALFALIFTIIVTGISFILENGRDMGAGYLPEKKGRANASKSILSIPGLFIRLNKGVIIGWLMAFLLLSAAYGTIYKDMESFLQGNGMIEQMFTYTGIPIEKSFTGTIMQVMIGLVAILPISLVNKLFSEEKALHLSQIYSTKVKRSQLYWTSIILSISGAFLGISLVAVGLGGTAISVMEESSMTVADFFSIGFNLLPSVLLFIGLAALALGWVPNMGRMIYIYLAYSFLLDYFGGMLNLPEWITKTAPQSWLPKMPIDNFDAKPFIVMTLTSILFMAAGYYGYKKRDMIG